MVDSYVKAGFERVKAKEDITKFIELMRECKKALREKEDLYLDTKAGAFYMIDRIESYIIKDVKIIEIKYQNIRPYYSKNMAEDESKELMNIFNKNI